MILPTLVLLHTVNKKLSESGIDSIEYCKDKNHFQNYPHKVEYVYNSRGYRDHEWPEDLHNAVWCFGDSFTAGIGQPFEHSWPQVLSRRLNQRTVNISMDGASNNWIARKINEMSAEIQPHTVVIQWSYTNRREDNSEGAVIKLANKKWQEFYAIIKDPSWPSCDDLRQFDQLPLRIQQEILENHIQGYDKEFIEFRHMPLRNQFDEARRCHFYKSEVNNDVENTIQCVELVTQSLPSSNVVHSFVPEFEVGTNLQQIIDYFSSRKLKFIMPFNRLDIARDGHHYDIKTAEFLCDQIIKLI